MIRLNYPDKYYKPFTTSGWSKAHKKEDIDIPVAVFIPWIISLLIVILMGIFCT